MDTFAHLQDLIYHLKTKSTQDPDVAVNFSFRDRVFLSLRHYLTLRGMPVPVRHPLMSSPTILTTSPSPQVFVLPDRFISSCFRRRALL